MTRKDTRHIVIVGAGPAGLGAAYELMRHGIHSIILEKNDRVGGLARTFRYQGYSFDVGPHRFYTKNNEILRFWREFLGSDFIAVRRLTRIYYRGKLFKYPIEPLDALRGLGAKTSIRVLMSYLRSRVAPIERPNTFEEWMVQHFGRALYEVFFKTYTEKVWGIPCRELGAEWARQRIKGLDLWEAVKSAFLGSKKNIKSLIDEFEYPIQGAGLLYERVTAEIQRGGTKVFLGHRLSKIFHRGKRILAVEVETGEKRRRFPADLLFVSAPITAAVEALSPSPPREVVAAARTLRYRDHITVNILMEGDNPFPDQWIYVHDPAVKMARIANYRNFSAAMAPGPKHPVSVEYFCFAASDDLWRMTDRELIAFAARELRSAGLGDGVGGNERGFVVREKDSYPLYYRGHRAPFETLRTYLAQFENLALIGRAGMYKYNNQDHATLTGFLAARNFMGERHDVWAVNADDEYLEEERSS